MENARGHGPVAVLELPVLTATPSICRRHVVAVTWATTAVIGVLRHSSRAKFSAYSSSMVFLTCLVFMVCLVIAAVAITLLALSERSERGDFAKQKLIQRLT